MKLCSHDLYRKFLQVTSERYSGLSLSEVSPHKLSHDTVSRWLKESKCRPKNIWEVNKNNVLGSSGVIIVDDTVIQKNYSQKIEIVRYQYSGTKHRVVKGIGLLNLLFIDSNENISPIDLRIWEPKEDKKTKNDHFRDMIKSAKNRGVNSEAVVADSWYSSLKNLKCIRDIGWNWVFCFKKNRIVNRGERIENINIPPQGLKVHLRGYGWIYLFKFVEKNGYIRYIGTNIENPSLEQVEKFAKLRWKIEIFHRELKQGVGLEKCQARSNRSQRNHIVLAYCLDLST